MSPVSSPAEEALAVVEEIQAFARATACALRAFAPELRALLQRLDPFLPAEEQRQAYRESHQGLPPLPLLDFADVAECLFLDTFATAIEELESFAGTSVHEPAEADGDQEAEREKALLAIWREIDPAGAPPWPEESPPAEGQA